MVVKKKLFRDPQITEIIIEINKHEEEGDRIYREAMHSLFANETDPKTLIAVRELYKCLEYVMDDIEDLANLTETIIMKNS